VGCLVRSVGLGTKGARFGNRCRILSGVDVDDFSGIFEAARSGDENAYSALWSRYAPGVAAYLRARGSRDPEDLTSEVFLAVFRDLGAFRGDEFGFRAYVYTVARRRLVDELRRRSRRPDPCSWSPLDDDRVHESAESCFVRREGSVWARSMIESLSPDQRDVLLLRIFGDLTIEQVAEVVGKRTGAVKALQRRGIATLRRKLDDADRTIRPAETEVRVR